MKNFKFIIIGTISLIIIAVTIITSITLCSKTPFKKVADYMSQKGTISDNLEYTHLSSKDGNASYSVLYYFKENSLVFFMEENTDKSISLLTVTEDKSLHKFAYVLTDSDSQTDSLKSITAEYDTQTSQLVNISDESKKVILTEKLKMLVSGIDNYILDDAGIKLSNLGIIV